MLHKYTFLLSMIFVINAVYYVDEKTGIVIEEYHSINTFEDTVDNVTTNGTSDMYEQQPEVTNEQ